MKHQAGSSTRSVVCGQGYRDEKLSGWIPPSSVQCRKLGGPIKGTSLIAVVMCETIRNSSAEHRPSGSDTQRRTHAMVVGCHLGSLNDASPGIQLPQILSLCSDICTDTSSSLCCLATAVYCGQPERGEPKTSKRPSE